MNDAPILRSKVFSAGTKFIVSEDTKDTIFGPGTTGFISYINGADRDYPNVIHYRAVITKRGKAGKERLEIGDLSTPVFDLEKEKVVDSLPDQKRKAYVHIEPVNIGPSVANLDTIDFIGWAAANTLYINKLSTKSKYKQVWPGDPNHPLNVARDAHKMFSVSPDETKKLFDTKEMRDLIIVTMHITGSTLVRSVMYYIMKASEIELSAITNICHVLGEPVPEEFIEDFKWYAKKNALLEYISKVFGSEEHMKKVIDTGAIKSVNEFFNN